MLNGIDWLFTFLVVYLFFLFVFRDYDGFKKILLFIPQLLSRTVVSYICKNKRYFTILIARMLSILFSMLISLLLNFILAVFLYINYFDEKKVWNFKNLFEVLVDRFGMENYAIFIASALIYYLIILYTYTVIYNYSVELFINSLDVNEQIKKYLVVDYTVLITLCGILPFLVDTVFDYITFKNDLKTYLLIIFVSFVVPYIHMFYKSLALEKNNH